MTKEKEPPSDDLTVEPLPPPEIEAALSELARIILACYRRDHPLPDSAGPLS